MKTTLRPKDELEKLVISLIKDDLINSKLIFGLEAMGLDALHYDLHLSETIFNLLEIPVDDTSEDIVEYYYKASRKSSKIDIKTQTNALDKLAREIFNEIIRRKKCLS